MKHTRTVGEWLEDAKNTLESSEIPTARLDALVLLEDAIQKNRAWLLANPDTHLQEATVKKLNSQIKRRAKHEPLAYIRGKSEFYGREFKVTPATLQPRPETETMIDLFKQIYKDEGSGIEGKVIADIGTGSGCIAITAKLEFPKLKFIATEINKDALKIAKQNAVNLGADIEFHQSNLLEPILNLTPPLFTLLCNLPYVPDSRTINQAAMQEPRLAIFGGADGLDLYRQLFAQLHPLPFALRPRFILTESLPFQHQDLTKIAKQSGYKLVRTEDFIQVFGLTGG